MPGQPRCLACGDPLTAADNGGDRCVMCQPHLNYQAQAAGAQRRLEREEIENVERQIRNLDGLINKLNRRIK